MCSGLQQERLVGTIKNVAVERRVITGFSIAESAVLILGDR